MLTAAKRMLVVLVLLAVTVPLRGQSKDAHAIAGKPGRGRIHLERAVIAADVGQIVNPDSLGSQIEGAFLQSASWTLKEQVAFDEQGVISVDWHSYPILRFRDAPRIETVLLNRPGLPYLGIGEGARKERRTFSMALKT